MSKFRELVISMLKDPHGVSERTYDLLLKEFDFDDLRLSVDATDGRYYLPEWWVEGIDSLETLRSVITESIPGCEICTACDGQIVVYTNLVENEDGTLSTYDPEN